MSFWRERFARPGVVVATGGEGIAEEARAAGAGTVHWDMYLRKRVGTPSDPADPLLMEKRADALFDYAVSVTGCETPLIALNELWGASFRRRSRQRRALSSQRLRFVSRLAERGGRPALLVSSEPFTGGDAAAWWRSVGAVSDLVLENYANANRIWRDGAVDGSRRLRERYRQSVARLLAVGIPASRIGIMVGFQTGPGSGGREGLKPRSRWFDVAKWQALAVRQIARELKISHVWSWGWAQRDARSNDPDKTFAACVWLWSRDASLCDAPGHPRARARRRRRDRPAEPAGRDALRLRDDPLTASSVAALAKVTRDRELALTTLVVRAVERERTQCLSVGRSRARAAHRGVRFRGSACGVPCGACAMRGRARRSGAQL